MCHQTTFQGLRLTYGGDSERGGSGSGSGSAAAEAKKKKKISQEPDAHWTRFQGRDRHRDRDGSWLDGWGRASNLRMVEIFLEKRKEDGRGT